MWAVRAGLVLSAFLALALAGPSEAGEPGTFGAKPWLLSPPTARPSPAQKQRAARYESGLKRELRRLEFKAPLKDIRSISRRNAFRAELRRIRRATRAQRR